MGSDPGEVPPGGAAGAPPCGAADAVEGDAAENAGDDPGVFEPPV